MPADKVRVTVTTDGNDVQYNGYTAQDVKSKARGVAQSAASTVQDVSSKAKDVAQATASTVQDTVQSGLTRTQKMLLVGLDLGQNLLRRNFRRRNLNKQARKNLKKAQKNLSTLQGTLQESVQSGLSKTQDTLQSGLGTATDVLGKTTKTAGKNLKKVTSNVKDVQDSLQDRIEAYQRKRARAKFLFRMGLLAGIVLALLYTPWPGTQTRQQLAGYWQLLSQRVQEWFENF